MGNDVSTTDNNQQQLSMKRENSIDTNQTDVSHQLHRQGSQGHDQNSNLGGQRYGMPDAHGGQHVNYGGHSIGGAYGGSGGYR